MSCRFCGCTEERACFDLRTGEACWWVAPNLCSFCLASAQVQLVLAAELAHSLAEQLPAYNDAQHAEARRAFAMEAKA
jgi:hypothetical protein